MSTAEVVIIRVTCDACGHKSIVSVDRPNGYYRPDGLGAHELPTGWTQHRLVIDWRGSQAAGQKWGTKHFCEDCSRKADGVE